jgi:hypothetical protein
MGTHTFQHVAKRLFPGQRATHYGRQGHSSEVKGSAPSCSLVSPSMYFRGSGVIPKKTEVVTPVVIQSGKCCMTKLQTLVEYKAVCFSIIRWELTVFDLESAGYCTGYVAVICVKWLVCCSTGRPPTLFSRMSPG